MEFIPLNVLLLFLAVLEITAKEMSLSFIIFMCNLNMFLFSRDYIKQIVWNIVYDFSQEILKLFLNCGGSYFVDFNTGNVPDLEKKSNSRLFNIVSKFYLTTLIY